LRWDTLGSILVHSISFVVLVKKKDGTLRMCIYYCVLNKKTLKIDLRSRYHQISIREKDIEKTTFKCHFGNFQFLVMPLRLTNAPATFQSFMNHIFIDQLQTYLLVFFNDILIYNKTWEENLKHLDEVLSIMQSQSHYAKESKCEFGMREILYLGHIINE